MLTLGGSWVFGTGVSDPGTKSWPAQMAKKYNIEVINLGQPGASNARNARIGVEELCRNPYYDYVIMCLAPGARQEILKNGKWHQIWPHLDNSLLNKIYAEMWLPWNDVQLVIMQAFYFMHSIKSMNIPLHMEGCTFNANQYAKEFSWIMNYNNDNDFNALGMPLADLNIGIADLDRKLKSLKSIHLKNLQVQPDYLNESSMYIEQPEVINKYGPNLTSDDRYHPNEQGYCALADYFANKIGLSN